MGRYTLIVTAYIDTDVLLYKFGFACEQAIEWEEGKFTYTGNIERAKSEFDSLIDSVIEELVAWSGDEDAEVEARMCFSSRSGSFRKLIYEDYKKNRTGKRKPTIMQEFLEWVRGEWGWLDEPWLEGDDILGVYGATYDPNERGRLKVMCSIDKDMLTVPGFHYNWDKVSDGVIYVSREEAAENFYTQVLTGDTVDNYPGCPGIGPKRAAGIISKAREEGVQIWDAIVSAYKDKGKDEVFAIQMARCAYILQPNYYDLDEGSIELWAPGRARKEEENVQG